MLASRMAQKLGDLGAHALEYCLGDTSEQRRKDVLAYLVDVGIACGIYLKRAEGNSCAPGATVFVVVTKNEGNPPKLGVFASAAGASLCINSEIDRMKPFYERRFKEPDPGPEFAEDRQAWWNNEMANNVGENQAFISYRSETVED